MADYLLDSGLVIRHLRNDAQAVALLRQLGRRSRLGVSTVTHTEVFAGMKPQEQYVTRKLLSRFVAYVVTEDIAQRAGEYLRDCGASGLSIPDAIIAATAVLNALTLVTLNPKHFQIRGVSVLPLPLQE
jgi:predicted nucleic acid-binding protein